MTNQIHSRSTSCPTCRSPNSGVQAYKYHRLSFLSKQDRSPFPKHIPIKSCQQCGHLWSDSPYISTEDFFLPERFHHPRYNHDPSQVQTEFLYATHLRKSLENSSIEPGDIAIDLRALSGRLLHELQSWFQLGKTIGFDFHSVTCNWAVEQYNHSMYKYDVGDPIDFLTRWIDQNPELKGQVKLVVQSHSILEWTKNPVELVELMLEILHPDGIWAVYEQLYDLFPKEICLSELFDPWAKQYFSTSSFPALFDGREISISCCLETTTRRVYLVTKQDVPFQHSPSTDLQPLVDHPRLEETSQSRLWQGLLGKTRGGFNTLLHKIDDKVLTGNSISLTKRFTLTPNNTPALLPGDPIIDVLVVSCGRPKALQKTLRFFMRMCQSETRRFRFIIHDDWIDSRAPAHEQCRNWIKQTQIFDEIHFAEENRGISRSVNFLLSRLQSDLYVHLEDDMVFIRPIDFDPLYQIFSDFPKVNQIRFNRTQTTPTIGAVSKIFGKYRARMFKFNETVLSMGSFWSNQAQIARSDSPFTRLMAAVDGRFHERVFNIEFAKNWLDPLDSYTHLGTFMYGPIGAAKVVYEAGDVSAHSIIQQSYPEDNTLTIDRFRK